LGLETADALELLFVLVILRGEALDRHFGKK